MSIEIKQQTKVHSVLPFSEVNAPRFFAGWPYYILLLAALTMGSSKVSSEARHETHYASVVPDPTLKTLGCSIAKAFKNPSASQCDKPEQKESYFLNSIFDSQKGENHDFRKW